MIKKFEKSLVSLLLVALLLLGSFPIGAATATGDIKTGVSGLKATYTGTSDNSKATISGKVITITAETTESESCGSTDYSSQTTTLTFQNSSSTKKVIKFLCEVEGKGSYVVADVETSSSGSYEGVLTAKTGTATITVMSDASEGGDTTVYVTLLDYDSAETRDIYVTDISGGHVEYEDPDDGRITLTQDYNIRVNNGTGSCVLYPVADAGYEYIGFIDGNNNFIGNKNPISFIHSKMNETDGDVYLTPLFLGETQPAFKVGCKLFTDFREAIDYAEDPEISTKTITLVKDGTISGSYTIPDGVTLNIPFDDSYTLYTDSPAVIYGTYETPTAFKTLTMAKNSSITVQNGGAISLGSKLSSKGQLGGYNGTPTGPDGRIQMMSGSNITLENGAKLYSWGYIYGAGTVEAKSGSTVYEAFQVKDWRGGSATSSVYNYAFIFNQYYIQNIEAKLKINYGASEKLYSSLNASSTPYPIGVDFIGTSSGMFRLTSSGGYLVREYNAGKDRMSYQMFGNATIAPLVISGVPMVGTVTTGDYRLPLNGGMSIDVQRGTTTVTQDLELLPGTEVSVQSGAEVEIASGKKVYLFDNDNWGNFSGSARMYAVGYSAANGTMAVRTAANMDDARIDVNGTLTVKGGLYTSSAGADITSTSGINGNNGKLYFSTTVPTSNATIYECANNSDKTAVTMCPPLLHNGDDSYSETISTGTSTWKYDKEGEHWYRYLVDFKFNNTLISRDYYCENNDTVTYNADWLENLGASASNGTAAVSGTDVNVTGVTADSTVTLTGTPKQYIPTFVLNEKQYSIYQSYTGNNLSQTVDINGETYYVAAQGDTPLDVGASCSAPTNASMGVIEANHNTIVWNMSGISATSGDPFRGTVPAGEIAQGPVYIYGFYSGYIAHNKTSDTYYVTLIDAVADLASDATAEIEMIADCGTFEEEIATQAYSFYLNQDITLDLNGHKAAGKILNNGKLNFKLSGGSFDGSVTNSAELDMDLGGGVLTATVTNNPSGTGKINLAAGTLTGNVTNNGDLDMDLAAGTLTGTVTNNSKMTVDLNGGTIDYHTGATAAASAYRGKAAVTNAGTLNIGDTAGGGKITTDAIEDSSTLKNYVSAVRNNAAGVLNMTGGTLDLKQTSVNNYGAALLNYGTANISDSTLTAYRGLGIYNTSTGKIALLKDSTVSVTLKSGSYAVYNNAGQIDRISGSTLSTINTTALYNYIGGTITTLENTTVSITSPSTANVYALYNYGSTITTIDGCTISGNSGINNRNTRGDAVTAANGATISKYGNIGTIKDTTVTVGQYAIYNGATIGTLIGSIFTSSPATTLVYGTYGTSNLNKDNPQCYTIYNSNLWWYDTAVWKQTDTKVDNDGTSMLQKRINEYKTTDDYKPTIGAITGCTITALNTSASAANGYALVNSGVINDINGATTIQTSKHPDNTSTKLTGSQYALQNISGGKIGTIGSGVTITAQTYAVVNQGARIAKTEVEYSTTYLKSGALASGGLATDYDYTYADVSTIGSTAATITATSQYAVQNYSKIGSITGTVSANYNVIVNAGAAGTTTSIESTTANSRVIEHRCFEGNDSSTTDNENRRYFEYIRNTDDGCYIGVINAAVTATGKGYQAITNQGYIGAIAGTVTTPTGLVTSSSTYYPLIYNGDQRQATLKQDETYYVESNGAGATKYLREFTYLAPTIGTISCTATNPQDYTIRNLGVINTLSGNISGKTITVANEAAGYYLTRKAIIFYSSATPFATSKGSSEVNCEYTKGQAAINTIDGATLSTTGTTLALRNYGYVGEIKNSTITSTSTNTIQNGAATTNSTVTSYTSNRLDVLTGCVPNGTSSCALNYDTTQTINEVAVRVPATIDKIGAGNYFQGTYYTLINYGRINEIDSGSGKTTIIYGSSRQAIYNLQGCYSRVTNTDAVLTNATGTLTNNYTYEYAPAYIGTIKNVFIFGKRQAILNGDGNATYCAEEPVTIGEIGEGAEVRTSATATYSAVEVNAANAKIGKISGGVFMTGNGSGIYGLNNNSTTYPVLITGGDFRGGSSSRTLAINDADNAAKYKYPAGVALSDDTRTATYHTLKSKVLTATTSEYYYVPETCTVTFDKQRHGSDVEEQIIIKGGKAAQPASPEVGSYVTESGAKYRFDGWYVENTCDNAYDFNSAVNEDITVYAKWTPVYTVIWKNGDETLETDADVASGTAPSFNGEEPTKAGDAQYTYAFDGWSTDGETVIASLPNVTADVTYIAVFAPTVNKYTVIWKNGDETLETDAEVPFGTAPSFNGATPAKAGDAQYSYTFAGWSTDGETVIASLPDVTGDVIYKAVFTQNVNKYTVTWKNGDETLETDAEVPYGTAPSFNGATPTKAGDAQYSYAFAGWSTDGETVIASLPNVTGDVIYKAVFTQNVNKYKVTWKNGEETLETDAEVPYNTVPSFNGATPTKAGDAQYSYTFAGWSTDGENVIASLPNVTGDATYIAVFTKTVNKYTVSWTIVTGGEAPSEQEIKTAVDAIIAQHASEYYNQAKTEGGEVWDFLPHLTLLKMGLAANFDLDAEKEYIARKVIGIMESNDSMTTEAESYWDSVKGTIVADLAASSFSNSSSGVADHEYLTAENKAVLATLAGATVTTLDTDTVEYGTTPSFEGETPAIEPDGEYIYVFKGWSTDGETVLDELPAVTGDVQYIAVFEAEEIAKHSLTLKDDIGVNFYFELSDGEDPDDYKMVYSWGRAWDNTALDGNYNYADGPIIVESEVEYITKYAMYRATVNIAAKEMNDTITASLYKNGELIATDTYKASDYAYAQIALNEDPELVALCKSMLTYATAAQMEFGYLASGRADYGLPAGEKYEDVYSANNSSASEELSVYNTKQKDGYTAYMGLYSDPALNSYLYNTYGHSYYATSLRLTTQTGYVMYLKKYNNASAFDPGHFSAEWYNSEIEDDAPAVEYTGEGSGFDYYTVSDIPAARTCEDIKVTIDDKTFIINTGSYMYDVLRLESTDVKSTNMKRTVVNLYNYYQASRAYFLD